VIREPGAGPCKMEVLVAPSTVEDTAYHEAAHAVAVVKYGVRLKDINVVCNGITNGQLHVEGLSVDPGTPLEATQVERWIVIHLAGMTAQRKYNPASRSLLHGSNDIRQVIDLLFRLNRLDEDMTFYKAMEKRTNDFVETHWSIIERLAKRLIERRSLTGDEATAEIIAAGAAVAAGFTKAGETAGQRQTRAQRV
jgi:hypothetical protein